MYPVCKLEPMDEEIAEEWGRTIKKGRDKGVHGVTAHRRRDGGKWPWRVSVWAMEHVRDVPLEARLRKRIAAALGRVKGVTKAVEEDREVWAIQGSPSGDSLVAAVAGVVDELADDIRAAS